MLKRKEFRYEWTAGTSETDPTDNLEEKELL